MLGDRHRVHLLPAALRGLPLVVAELLGPRVLRRLRVLVPGVQGETEFRRGATYKGPLYTVGMYIRAVYIGCRNKRNTLLIQRAHD